MLTLAHLCAGNFKAAELIAYLKGHVGAGISPDGDTEEEDAGAGSSKGKKEKEEKEVMQVVRDLNATDFEALSEEEDAWLVAFYGGTVWFEHVAKPFLIYTLPECRSRNCVTDIARHGGPRWTEVQDIVHGK